MAKTKILIVDDEKPTRDVMARALSATYDCLTAPDAAQALAAVTANPDLALMLSDVRMPGESGVSLVQKAKAVNPGLACILLTAYGTVELAVEAMKTGADDFLTKPVTDLDQLELRVAKAIRTRSLERQVEELQSRLDEKFGLDNFTGRSPAMEKVYRLVRQAAKSSASVLVTGPSGTGKELVARALHDLSPRAAGPFVAVECAALSSSLLESELFGYEKNAFTGADQKNAHKGRFEAAQGGTLFLDEIGEIDLATQVKLLRVLESRTIQRVGGTADIPVDFRLVAATNRDLARLVVDGRFREDLYYRLNVVEIELPPLKDRPGDVTLLVSRFLKEYSAANGSLVTGIDQAAMEALERYAWPGNVRQLRNTIERMVVLSAGGRLTLEDVPETIRLGGEKFPLAPVPAPATADGVAPVAQPSAPVAQLAAATASPRSLAESERREILSAIEAERGNKTKAAERLGISRRTLHRKLKGWGLR